MSFLAAVRRWLKASGIVLTLAVPIPLAGCWVTSLNPLYEALTFQNMHKDADIVFESSLVGSWAVPDECRMPVTITSKDKEVYDLRRNGCDESDKPTHMEARLVKLDDRYFFDVYPTADDVCDMCFSKHNIFLIQFDKDSFSLTPIDSDWLKKALVGKKVTLMTLPGDTDTIISSSKELKAFCRKYANDPEVFKSGSGVTFTRR